MTQDVIKQLNKDVMRERIVDFLESSKSFVTVCMFHHEPNIKAADGYTRQNLSIFADELTELMGNILMETIDG